MKKNKTVAYMLAATLLVGGSFLGTKAWFTDKVNVEGEVTISTGDVDIEIVKDSGWKLQTEGDDNESEEAQFDNLKYGDVLHKTMIIKNNGTLNAKVNLTRNIKEEDLPNGFSYMAFIQKDGQQVEPNYVMKPGEELTVKLQLSVTKGGQHNEGDSFNGDTQEQKVIKLKDSYTVDDTQVNAK